MRVIGKRQLYELAVRDESLPAELNRHQSWQQVDKSKHRSTAKRDMRIETSPRTRLQKE